MYSDCIEDDYKQENNKKFENKQTVIKNFKINISPFDKIKFTKSKRDIYISENNAKVIIDSSIDLTIRERRSTYNLKERINLSKKNGKWKITKESKLDLFSGFVFGEKAD